MSTVLVIAIVLSLLGSGPANAATPPSRRDDVKRCERTASRAACDPQTGYIAGPSGPCRASDLRCIEREWTERGRVRYYPDLGICARDHEDGGTIVGCPPGVGPSAGSGSPGGRNAGTTGSGRNRTTSPGGARTTTPGGRSTTRRTAPPPPPPPPTLDEAITTCPALPAPRLYRNPDHEGVTGMDTWLWAEHHAPLSSSGSIRGHRVTCRAVPESWTWHTGDGAGYTRSRPGSEPPHHAAEHVYERKGAYTQRLVVRWRMETTQGVTTTTRESSRAYRVVEIRGALVE